MRLGPSTNRAPDEAPGVLAVVGSDCSRCYSAGQLRRLHGLRVAPGSTLRRGNATAQRAARQRSRSITLERIALPSLWDWPMRAGYDRPVLSKAPAQKIRLHLAMFHRPRSRHRPRASADGSLTQHANKTGVRLWTDRSPACGVQVRSIRLIPTRSARSGPPTCFCASRRLSPFDRAIFGWDSGGTMVMFGTLPVSP